MDPHGPLWKAHAAGKQILAQWIALRPELSAKLFPAEERPYEWHDIAMNNLLMEGLHEVGCWMYLRLRTPMPPYPHGTTSFLGRPYLNGNTFDEAVHCCSMYTVLQSVVKGLKPGPATKNNLVGVFAFKTTEKKSVARSSSGYCVYDVRLPGSRHFLWAALDVGVCAVEILRAGHRQNVRR